MLYLKNIHTKLLQKKILLIIASIALAIAIAVVTLWMLNSTSQSYPLDNQLEYVGKDDYGCHLFCDSSPQSTYYYATDMTIEQLITHFKNAQLDQKPRTINQVTDFTLSSNGQDISVYHFSSKKEIIEKYPLSQTTKSFIISIPSFDYQAAKAAL